MSLLGPVGFIGLGQLGAPVAANLLDAGVDLVAYNRTASKTEAFAARGAKIVSQPREAVVRHGVVFSLLWDGQSVEEIVKSDGFLDALGEGEIGRASCRERV